VISPTARQLLEHRTRATGTKKARLIEDALRHYLADLEALPADTVVHPRIVVTRRSGRKILARTKAPRPTRALRELMAPRGD